MSSTSASVAQNSDPCSESLQRRGENTRKRSPQREHTSNSAGTDSCGIRSFSELELAPPTGFNQSQSSVSNDVLGKTMAADCRMGEVCTMCKIKPSAVSLMVILQFLAYSL